jgi:hypothetical protein
VSDHSPGDNGIRYEGSDADTGGIVRIGLIVAAVVLATVFLLRPVLSFLGARQAGFDAPPAPMAVEGDQRAPEPRLQEHPFDDVAKQRAADRPFLEEYAWVDEKAGTVRIPIDEALKIVARRGLPAREQPAPAGAPVVEPASAAAPPIGGHP